MSKKVITKTVEKSVKQYTVEHPELNRKDVYKLIKEGTLKAHKGYKGAWVIEDVVSETIEVPDENPSKGNTKKGKSSKKTPKTYTTKEFLEIYNTYFRIDDFKAKMYFLGNPYTIYNPYFLYYGVNFNELRPGNIQSGKTWVVQNYKMNPKLLEHMLEVNPLYQEDEEYKAYALEGKSVNDTNIRLGKMKNNYKLMHLISIGKATIGIYRNFDFNNRDDSYYCEYFKNNNCNRDVFCFDFNDLMEGKVVYSRFESSRFEAFKNALRLNRVEFENPAVYNQIIEIYSYL